jgi:hypothetical protein
MNLLRLFPVIRRFRKSDGTLVPYVSDYRDHIVITLMKFMTQIEELNRISYCKILFYSYNLRIKMIIQFQGFPNCNKTLKI